MMMRMRLCCWSRLAPCSRRLLLSSASSSFHHLGSLRRHSSSFSVQESASPRHHPDIDNDKNDILPIVHHDGNTLSLSINNDTTHHHLSAAWLWTNDPTYSLHPHSGQRQQSVGDCLRGQWSIKTATIVPWDASLHPPWPASPTTSAHALGGIYEHGTQQQQAESWYNNNNNRKMVVQIQWKSTAGYSQRTSFYPLDWLVAHSKSSHQTQKQRRQQRQVTPLMALGAKDNPGCQSIPTFDFDSDFLQDERRLFDVLHSILHRGAVLLENVPTTTNDNDNHDDPWVSQIGKALAGGRLSHGHLYGDVFAVQSKGQAAENIAYTTHPLPPHQDLIYYQSPPFLQLLHCRQNSNVTGGESVLVDGLAGAQFLQRVAPRAFRILTDCPATFVKQRVGADLVRVAPHIVTTTTEHDDDQEIVALHWAPPFEGPSSEIPTHRYDEYAHAYSLFELLVDNSINAPATTTMTTEDAALMHQCQAYAHAYTWEHKLQEGQLLIFNNQRMLHGRRGFELLDHDQDSPSKSNRFLQGCYTSVDETLNQYRLLARKLGHAEDGYPNVGNGSVSVP